MKKMCHFLFCLFIFSISVVHAHQSNEIPLIDKAATNKAPWKIGEVLAQGDGYCGWGKDKCDVYRKFLGVDEQGYYIAQDFYVVDDVKRSDPYFVMSSKTDFFSKTDFSAPFYLPINGVFTAWFPNGNKWLVYDLFQDGVFTGSITVWEEDGYKSQTRNYINNIIVGQTNWYENGRKENEYATLDHDKKLEIYTEWHENGRKKVEYHYLYNNETRRRDYYGLMISWYENGVKKEEAHYDDGKKNGLYTTWSESGQKLIEVEYKDDVAIKNALEIGTVTATGNAFCGRGKDKCDVYRKFLGTDKQGYYIAQDFYVEGDVKRTDPFFIMPSKPEFLNNTDFSYPFYLPINGFFTVWFINGNKWTVRDSVKDGQFTGTWTTWSVDGHKSQTREYINYSIVGQINWYENGKKKDESVIPEDKKSPIFYTEWYENGQKKLEYHYLYNEKTRRKDYYGLVTHWYEDGVKKEETHYDEGRKNGLLTTWYNNGQKWKEIEYQDDKENGAYIIWYENGTKKEEGRYQNFAKQGVWINWNESGEKVGEVSYIAGKKDGNFVSVRSNDSKWEEGSYKNDLREGKWTLYYADGAKWEERFYVSGSLVAEKLKR